MADEQRELTAQLRALGALYLAGTQVVNAWVQDHRPQIENVVSGVHAFLQQAAELAQRHQEARRQRLLAYPALQDRITGLAHRSWFISLLFGLSDLDQLVLKLDHTPDDDLDGVIASLYRDDLSHQVESILREFPARAFLLQPAVAAHLRGEYAVSILAFLALADGICSERAHRELFQRFGSDAHISERAKSEIVAWRAKEEAHDYLGFYALLSVIAWTPITEKLPIFYSEKERRAKGYNGLNRHTVLHGLATEDYATEENSLKAFSLLSSLSALMADLDRDPLAPGVP